MAQLVLVPSLKDFNRKEIEEHIKAKRVRRIQAAQVYHEGKAAKLQHESDQIAKKFLRALDRLRVKLEIAEKADEAITKALTDLGQYTEGYAELQAQIEDLTSGEDSDDV